MTVALPHDREDLHALLAGARWFGGKGREWTVGEVRRVGVLPGSTPAVTAVVDLVEVLYADAGGGGDAREFYQLPLSLRSETADHLEHARVGTWTTADGAPLHAYDAVHDRDAMALWLGAFDAAAGPASAPPGAAAGPVFHRLEGHDLDLTTHSTLFTGEQSNSSVAFGEDALLKVFRRLTPGTNPDIEIHEVLTASGSDHVAALYGWLEAEDPFGGETLQLAMLQQFLRTATDGWELALASVRNLYVEADLRADEVGGDFAAEAGRLGEALAEVHGSLAEQFGTTRLSGPELAALADTMTARLDDAVAVVPDLAAHRDAVLATFDAVRSLAEGGEVEVQRIHGDLHLGQTLRTVKGWKIVDFEGEPAKPLAERSRPDSAWRDVAGMLRSFDYAPSAASLTGRTADSGDEAEQQAYRAAEWAARNGQAFLLGYAGRPLTAQESTLLRAYVLDKAVYETVYETRNRPGWVQIPLEGIRRWEAS
ncbi:MAG: hypothetical protein ACI379_00885 [Nocardioides sp.]|uniref:maltokinase N-terminal cap-like domain-containing protein n=1 Tax=Nocardioides sp. TaxID=35761 RepID=UPI003EFD6572